MYASALPMRQFYESRQQGLVPVSCTVIEIQHSNQQGGTVEKEEAIKEAALVYAAWLSSSAAADLLEEAA